MKVKRTTTYDIPAMSSDGLQLVDEVGSKEVKVKVSSPDRQGSIKHTVRVSKEVLPELIDALQQIRKEFEIASNVGS